MPFKHFKLMLFDMGCSSFDGHIFLMLRIIPPHYLGMHPIMNRVRMLQA